MVTNCGLALLDFRLYLEMLPTMRNADCHDGMEGPRDAGRSGYLF